MAGGSEILQATELRVAGESAQFAIAEVRRGLFPLGGSTVRLQHQIPFTMAADLLLTGRMISAAEAKDIGLIGHVVPDGQALDKAVELAELIAANGPLAVKAVLRSMRETKDLPDKEALALEQEIGFPIFLTEDAQEGPRLRREAPRGLQGPLTPRHPDPTAFGDGFGTSAEPSPKRGAEVSAGFGGGLGPGVVGFARR